MKSAKPKPRKASATKVKAIADRIGTAGWSIPRPASDAFQGEGSHLERYARVMNCAEINSSFHRSHRESTWTRWAESVPEDFRFAVKMRKTITHEAKLDCSAEMIESFLAEAGILGPKLGPILIQLPPSLAFDENRADKFFHILREKYAGLAALEPRHASWSTGEPAYACALPHRSGRCRPCTCAGSSDPGWMAWPDLLPVARIAAHVLLGLLA